MQIDTSILIAFILYFGAMLAIGIYFYRKSKNISDYFLGGRQLGSWVTALSAQASDMSGWLLRRSGPGFPPRGLLSAWGSVHILIGSLSQCGCANSRMSPTIRSPSRSTFKTVS